MEACQADRIVRGIPARTIRAGQRDIKEIQGQGLNLRMIADTDRTMFDLYGWPPLVQRVQPRRDRSRRNHIAREDVRSADTTTLLNVTYDPAREQYREERHAVWRRTGMTVVFITHSVEEAVYLGTEVVAMSPRPGRIVAKLPMTFAREHATEGIRAVKSRPDFVAAREKVLSLIWSMGDDH